MSKQNAFSRIITSPPQKYCKQSITQLWKWEDINWWNENVTEWINKLMDDVSDTEKTSTVDGIEIQKE